MTRADLVLDDGHVATGRSFGAPRNAAGEVVFHTAMTGYVEALTDPSYRGQILVLTYPLQGNYGVPAERFESARVQVEGLVVAVTAAHASHHAAVRSLGEWLRQSNVPGVEGVDTRTITRRLRERGTMPGKILLDASAGALATPTPLDTSELVDMVTCDRVVDYPGGDLRVVMVDAGAKENIVRSLLERGASVRRVPIGHDLGDALADADGLVLSNGPGDPADQAAFVAKLRAQLGRRVPTLGICLGHQLLALAAGAKTYKLKYGHRSHNQPVIDRRTRRAYVTSQNHGYAVEEGSLGGTWETWFENANDHTNEGIRSRDLPCLSAQFHPEAAGGPHDTSFIFDEFFSLVGQIRSSRAR